MIRVVTDTNVLVSALLVPHGNEALVLLAVRQGLVLLYFSESMLAESMLAEHLGVLARPKFSFATEQFRAVHAMLQTHGELVEPLRSPSVSPDATDTKFLDCAFTVLADFLVTGNKKHFPEPIYSSTRIVSAGELVTRIASAL